MFEDDKEPGRYWLADGWHRVEAQCTSENDAGVLDPAVDHTEVEAEVHPGGKLAAMLFAAAANMSHGRRRDRGDAIVAAKVAIRALTLQNPTKRPTVEAIKATARVGTATAQRAIKELEAEPPREAEPRLPPKDPRGGVR